MQVLVLSRGGKKETKLSSARGFTRIHLTIQNRYIIFCRLRASYKMPRAFVLVPTLSFVVKDSIKSGQSIACTMTSDPKLRSEASSDCAGIHQGARGSVNF